MMPSPATTTPDTGISAVIGLSLSAGGGVTMVVTGVDCGVVTGVVVADDGAVVLVDGGTELDDGGTVVVTAAASAPDGPAAAS